MQTRLQNNIIANNFATLKIARKMFSVNNMMILCAPKGNWKMVLSTITSEDKSFLEPSVI